VSNDRLKIAVFIDFDNIEIGVKTTLGGQFDVGAVLEAVKERGEVVSKVAYGDWTRATDYGRSMSQHAIHMVQRNLTPGGDKNGADINLALDALEMAFTHSHINAFVIVGGDSDFITLVEKLKQYDRKVFVVGGRSFTSHVMQKNCTEFVAYEDILGTAGRGRQAGGRTRPLTDIALAMPLLRRAIKLLADREMTPQLGLLKSTLLQLDSSFSEKAYGAGSFRDFVEKLAKAGHVTMKGSDRSFTVELREAAETAAVPPEAAGAEQTGRRPAREPRGGRERGGASGARSDRSTDAPATGQPEGAAETPAPAMESEATTAAEGAPRPGPTDGYRLMVQAFSRGGAAPRFPMYVRQVKQFIKGLDESFDERRYGFAGMLDALRYGQREGLFKLDRDRQGGVRVHPGPQYLTLTQAPGAVPEGGLPPQAAVAAPIQDAPYAPDQPQAAEPAPDQADTVPAPPEAEEAPPALAGDAPPPELPETPAEAAPAPRKSPRKRAVKPAAPRAAKKPAPATGDTKKRVARPRAKKA